MERRAEDRRKKRKISSEKTLGSDGGQRNESGRGRTEEEDLIRRKRCVKNPRVYGAASPAGCLTEVGDFGGELVCRWPARLIIWLNQSRTEEQLWRTHWSFHSRVPSKSWGEGGSEAIRAAGFNLITQGHMLRLKLISIKWITHEDSLLFNVTDDVSLSLQNPKKICWAGVR